MQSTQDINAAFDDILLCEERLIKEGFREGELEISARGNVQGYHLGYHRGAEIGAELGYYSGIVDNKLGGGAASDKILKQLLCVKRAIQDFPKTNDDESVDPLEQLNSIRVQFRKVCALMKIDAIYPEVDKFSF